MPDMLNPEFAYRRLRERIDDPYARAVVIIIVDQSGELETASRGVPNDAALFEILHAVTDGVAGDIVEHLQPIERRHGTELIIPRWIKP